MPLRPRWPAFLVVGSLFFASAASAEGWKAGTAKVTITPSRPVWMAGYGARDRPSEGAVHDLWAKALVLEDGAGGRSLLVTLDVCGIDRALSLRLRDGFMKAHGLSIERVVLACSHTHSGPVVGENLVTMYKLDEPQRRRVAEYTREFEAKVTEAVDGAFRALEPVEIAWDSGRADFAVNRRTNVEKDVPALREKNALAGPVDHDVPVLRVRSVADRRLKAVVFGYACHCTVLSGYEFCGDYAGFAQLALETQSPGCQAMFVAGCGGDQNPLPRRSVGLAAQYGGQLSRAVTRVLESPMRSVGTSLVAAAEVVPLSFGDPPSRAQIEADAASSNLPVANRAKKLLAVLNDSGRLPESYPYPVQVWRLGDLTWVFLGGEVVVDYSLRIKRNLGGSRTWVSAYCNDVMAYIPSARVLAEGGYEGATAMIYYGQPTTWSPAVETQIFEGLGRALKAVSTPPP